MQSRSRYQDENLELQSLLRSYGLSIPLALVQKLDEASYREYCRLVKKEQQKRGSRRKEDKINLKRRAKEILRAKTKGKGIRHYNMPKRVLAGVYRECRIMDSLWRDRKTKWLPPLKRTKHGEITFKNFSFIDNPIGTIESLFELTKAESQVRSIKINFDDDYCLDIGPYLILGIIRQAMIPVSEGGIISPKLMAVLEAVRLRHFLRMGPMKEVMGRGAILPFPIQQKNIPAPKSFSALALEPSTKEKTQDSLVQVIDGWLNAAGMEFTKGGRGWITAMTGEVLDNAERHSDPLTGEGNWSIAGFMTRRTDKQDKDHLLCHLTIVCLGESISETISLCPTDAKEKIEEYARKHLSGLHKKKYSEETLKTVCALQDGVSRFDQTGERVTGGTGIMEFVNLLNELGGNTGTTWGQGLTIISGNSCIMFKGPYPNGISTGPEEPRVQWFNSQNSKSLPPDPDYIFDLPRRIPGTIVSMRFSLEEEYLQTVAENND